MNQIYKNILWSFAMMLLGIFPVTSQKDIKLELINQLKGISASGYSPLWRIAFTQGGLDVGMWNLQSGIYPFKNITKINGGWMIEAQSQNVSLILNVSEEPGLCAMSKQWYPFQSNVVIKIQGRADAVLEGTAIYKNQKPLPPHPEDAQEQFKEISIKKEVVYLFLDQLKFDLMTKNFSRVAKSIGYPLRINSASGPSIMIGYPEDFIRKSDTVFTKELIDVIMRGKYKDIYQNNGQIGVAGGVLMLDVMNGRPMIKTINKN